MYKFVGKKSIKRIITILIRVFMAENVLSWGVILFFRDDFDILFCQFEKKVYLCTCIHDEIIEAS